MDERQRVSKDFRDFFERLQVLRRERPGGMERLLLAMATGYDYRQYQKVRPQSKPAEVRVSARKRAPNEHWVSIPGLAAAEGHV
jgi:hypothetical protein